MDKNAPRPAPRERPAPIRNAPRPAPRGTFQASRHTRNVYPTHLIHSLHEVKFSNKLYILLTKSKFQPLKFQPLNFGTQNLKFLTHLWYNINMGDGVPLYQYYLKEVNC